MTSDKKGILYGVGVGPGDPELLTLKAWRLINENKYIAYPGKCKEDTLAYRIIESVAERIEEKEFLSCYVEMTKEKEKLNENYWLIAEKIEEVLDKGENVVFLTLGDPTIYATYMYVHQLVEKSGYKTEIVNGVPSFCAAAARIGISLAERSEQLHIVPASYQIEDALLLPGNKILMKSASRLGEVKKLLIERSDEVYMVENCGMENERIFYSAEEIDERAGYLSLIVVKEKQEEE